MKRRLYATTMHLKRAYHELQRLGHQRYGDGLSYTLSIYGPFPAIFSGLLILLLVFFLTNAGPVGLLVMWLYRSFSMFVSKVIYWLTSGFSNPFETEYWLIVFHNKFILIGLVSYFSVLSLYHLGYSLIASLRNRIPIHNKGLRFLKYYIFLFSVLFLPMSVLSFEEGRNYFCSNFMEVSDESFSSDAERKYSEYQKSVACNGLL